MTTVSLDDVIEINKNCLNDGENHVVLDMGRLDSALGNQFAPYELDEQAIASTYKSLVINHAFENGNKRTAFLVLIYLSEKNNKEIKLNEDELINLTLEIASEGGSKISVNHLANVLFGLELDESLIKEELVSDEEAFWNIRNSISDVASDKYDEVNLILDNGKIRPITNDELANKYAVSIEQSSNNDYKSKEDIEKVANEYGAERIMFFVYKGQYGGEYSLLFSGPDAEDKVKELKKKYNQDAYARFDSNGIYHEETKESLDRKQNNSYNKRELEYFKNENLRVKRR